MAFYQLISEQIIPSTIDEVWNFISSPGNLKEITPRYMNFEITSKNLPEKMYEGMIISYKVSPLPALRMTWVTEITYVEEKKYFVDEQRIGPYKMWHHQHKIEAVSGGVKMTDIVSYQPPFGFLGSIANFLFIKRQLKKIFDFRALAVEKRFGKASE